MPKTKEVKFHSSKYDSIWLPERMHKRMLPDLIQIDLEGIDWPGMEDEQESHCWIYTSKIPEGDGTASEFYIVSFHDLDDDNGPYKLYTAYTLADALNIRNEIRVIFPKAAVAHLANVKKILSKSL